MAETPFRMGGNHQVDDDMASQLRRRGFGSPDPAAAFAGPEAMYTGGTFPGAGEGGKDLNLEITPNVGLPETRLGGGSGSRPGPAPLDPGEGSPGAVAQSQASANLGAQLAQPGRGGTESRGPATSSAAIDGPGKMLFGQRVRHQLDPLASGTAPGMGVGGGTDDEVKRLLELLGQGA